MKTSIRIGEVEVTVDGKRVGHMREVVLESDDVRALAALPAVAVDDQPKRPRSRRAPKRRRAR